MAKINPIHLAWIIMALVGAFLWYIGIPMIFTMFGPRL